MNQTGFSTPWRRCNLLEVVGRARSSSISPPVPSFRPLQNYIVIESSNVIPFRNAQPLENPSSALAFNPRFRLLNLLSNRPLEYGVFYLSRKSGTVQRELFGLPPKTTNPQEVGP